MFGSTPFGGLTAEAILREDDAYALPEGVNANAAAGFELNYGTVWHGLVDCCDLKEGETLLVLGASGGVGMAAVDIGQALGCTVVACASTATKLAACKAAGAEGLINYEEGDFKTLLKASGYYGDVDVRGEGNETTLNRARARVCVCECAMQQQ